MKHKTVTEANEALVAARVAAAGKMVPAKAVAPVVETMALAALDELMEPKHEKVLKPKPEPRAKCGTFGHQTKAGKPCTASVLLGQTWCTDHRPAIGHLTAAEVEWVARQVAGTDGTNAGLAWVVEQIGWGRVRALAGKAGA